MRLMMAWSVSKDVVQDPVRFLGAAEDVLSNGLHALDQRRDIRVA